MISSRRLTQETCSLRHHFVTLLCPLLIATTFIGCSSGNTPQVPTQPSPVTITQSFSGTLTVNGAQTHSFTVDRAGTVSAQVKSLSDQAATLGVSLGTYNGSACTIIISKTDAVLNTLGGRNGPINRPILRLAQRRRQADQRSRLHH